MNRCEFWCWVGLSSVLTRFEFRRWFDLSSVLNRFEFRCWIGGLLVGLGVGFFWVWWVMVGCSVWVWWVVVVSGGRLFSGICCLWWMVMVSNFFVVVSVVVVSSSFDLGVFSFWWVCGYGYLIGRLNKRVWPIYRYGFHKKVEKLSDEKLSEVCQMGGYRKVGYFKWWVMSDENWVRRDE